MPILNFTHWKAHLTSVPETPRFMFAIIYVLQFSKHTFVADCIHATYIYTIIHIFVIVLGSGHKMLSGFTEKRTGFFVFVSGFLETRFRCSFGA